MPNQVICEHPRIIVNPMVKEFLHKYRNYTINGVVFKLAASPYIYYSAVPKQIYQSLDLIKLDNIDSSYITDTESGETYPLYLAVPCGHCALCRESKALSFVRRCNMESQCYDCLPWFFTLTYHPSFLPDDGVSVRDCQLFLKRLRINLERAGYPDKIRYCLVSEYGKNGTKRPHYHGIFWNLHPTKELSYIKLQDILNQSWQNGFTMSRVVSADDKSFYYTTKYLRKLCVVPSGKNDIFMLSSRKGGGIGAPFLDKIKNRINKNNILHYPYLDRHSNKLQEIRFDRYVLKRVLPSFCDSIHSSFRSACKRVSFAFKPLLQQYPNLGLFQYIYDKIKNDWSNHFFCPMPDKVPLRCTMGISYQQLVEDCLLLRKFYTKSFDWDAAYKCDVKRKLLLSHLFQYTQPIDLKSYAYSVKERQSRSYSLIQI